MSMIWSSGMLSPQRIFFSIQARTSGLSGNMVLLKGSEKAAKNTSASFGASVGWASCISDAMIGILWLDLGRASPSATFKMAFEV